MTEFKVGDAPLVSVVIPAFNCENSIRNAIASVESQSLRDLEIVVIDDGSTDGTLAICRDLEANDPRIRVIHKGNGGVSSARNAGLAVTRGEWVAFLDADDLLDSCYLENLVSCASQDVDIVIGGATRVRRGSKEPLANGLPGLLHKDEIRYLMMQLLDEEPHGSNPCSICILGCICSKLFRKSLLHGVVFDERVAMREDAVFVLETLSRANVVAVSDECGYIYNVTEGTASLKYHPDFDSEAEAFLSDCEEVWEREGLPSESFHRGALYYYMSWLKLYALHPDQPEGREGRRRLISDSFNEQRWLRAFSALRGKRLNAPYAALRFAFGRSVGLIELLKKANDLKKELA